MLAVVTGLQYTVWGIWVALRLWAANADNATTTARTACVQRSKESSNAITQVNRPTVRSIEAHYYLIEQRPHLLYLTHRSSKLLKGMLMHNLLELRVPLFQSHVLYVSPSLTGENSDSFEGI
jgi:hypothetical protein